MSHQNPKSSIHTIAFYNTENLFDYTRNRSISRTDFDGATRKSWTESRYQQKIYNTALVISKIGIKEVHKPPTLIGLAEVENDAVLTDLINSMHLQDYDYGFIRYDSPDTRGMDVALVYDRSHFKVDASDHVFLDVENEHGVKDTTRDILKVTGLLEGEKIHVLVNHWPSRHRNSDPTGYKRMQAAKKVSAVIEDIRKEDKEAKIIVMGDFNDNPRNESIQFLRKSQALFNPMETISYYSRGSVNHLSRWALFDQILLSSNFLNPDSSNFTFSKVEIFDEKFLTHPNGKNKGQPLRTYAGRTYIGGFSDHFPVYLQLKKEQQNF